MVDIRGFSLTQPWATLVAVGAKTIETRSWATRYRGLLLIQAAKGFPRACQNLCEEGPWSVALAGAPASSLPRGAVIAIAQLADVVSTDVLQPTLTRTEERFGDFGEGRYGWILKNVRALRAPIPCRGALGLWTVPADVLAQIDAAGLFRA